MLRKNIKIFFIGVPDNQIPEVEFEIIEGTFLDKADKIDYVFYNEKKDIENFDKYNFGKIQYKNEEDIYKIYINELKNINFPDYDKLTNDDAKNFYTYLSKFENNVSIQNLEQKLKILEDEKRKLSDEIEKLEKQNSEIQGENVKSIEKNEVLRIRYKKIQQENEDLRTKFEKLQQKNKELKKKKYKFLGISIGIGLIVASIIFFMSPIVINKVVKNGDNQISVVDIDSLKKVTEDSLAIVYQNVIIERDSFQNVLSHNGTYVPPRIDSLVKNKHDTLLMKLNNIESIRNNAYRNDILVHLNGIRKINLSNFYLDIKTIEKFSCCFIDGEKIYFYDSDGLFSEVRKNINKKTNKLYITEVWVTD